MRRAQELDAKFYAKIDLKVLSSLTKQHILYDI